MSSEPVSAGKRTRATELDRVAYAVEGAESSHGTNAAMWRAEPAGPQGPMQVSEKAAVDAGGATGLMSNRTGHLVRPISTCFTNDTATGWMRSRLIIGVRVELMVASSKAARRRDSKLHDNLQV